MVLDAPATAIDQAGPSVRVTVAESREFTADAVLLTILFTVLQKIDARPAWTVGKQRMFREMAWDTTVKVIV